MKMFKISALLVLLAVATIECNMTSYCGKNQMRNSYLDIAVDMITKAKFNTPIHNDCDGYLIQRAVDCADIFHMGFKKSGVYKVQPMNRLTEDKFVNVYCDMETDEGGWTVIQRRGDFQKPYDYFFKDWKNYKEGFGDLEKDFWLGNDNIFALTSQKLYCVRFDLKDVHQEKRYAVYDKFWIDDENQKYTLHISDYTGNAGDSMLATHNHNAHNHNNQKFTTKDQDNDKAKNGNCAEMYKGAWWYNDCHFSNLNGFYLKGKLNDTFAHKGVVWNSWKHQSESLEWTEIKIRPKNYRRSLNF